MMGEQFSEWLNCNWMPNCCSQNEKFSRKGLSGLFLYMCSYVAIRFGRKTGLDVAAKKRVLLLTRITFFFFAWLIL